MLTFRGKDFYLNDKKMNIYAGAIHYFRVPAAYWEDRLKKLKAAGFNTVETYACWNLHEPVKGQFDFSGMLDIERFLQTAADLGLYAIVRPGPYICAEWEFGGLPAWLLKDPQLRLRCYNEPYLTHVSDYYKEFLRRVAPHQVTKGGNVIALQVENEYGSYGNDKAYLKYVEQLMLDCGIDTLLFTSDGPQDDMLAGGTLPNLLAIGNFGSRAGSAFKKLREFQGDKPCMCGEFWDGWFDHWGEKIHHTRPVSTLLPDLKSMLAQDGNFSFYMFHGGTNFGFMAGANHVKQYEPTVTSYDYDCLLNEWGGYTPKYHAVRKVLLAHQGLPNETLPPEPKLQSIGKVALTAFAPLMAQVNTLGDAHTSVTPEPMEYYGQNYGLIHYHHKLKGTYGGRLYLDGLADRAHVFVNGQLKGIVYRNDKEQSVQLGNVSGETDIDVLVEAMGRVNYGPKMMDRKGVTQIRINNQLLFHWDVHTLPLQNLDAIKWDGQRPSGAPLFLKGSFRAASKDDCFVHLKGFKKGFVFINGFNLGRYWEVGPQQSLYLPGTLLQEENELIVLELDGTSSASVELTDKHLLSKKRFLFF